MKEKKLKALQKFKVKSMDIKKLITGLTLSLLLGNGVVVAANIMGKGWEAYLSGDFKTALAEWTPLAEQGEAEAQADLALLYQKGKGVSQSYKMALKWYTKAAEQGFHIAQGELGLMYEYGEGVPSNYKTAVKWYSRAAEQGNSNSQANLGVMYANGTGVLTDYQRAYMWFNLANYNGSEQGGKNKDRIAKQMTPADISKAQDMSSRLLREQLHRLLD